MLTAIIVAAGSSRRMGFDKLSAPVAGKPVIEHTIGAFERANSVADIIVVTREDRLAEFGKLTQGKVREVIAGGEHRQDSVRAGLERLGPQTKYVAVHDAARPLVTPEQIERVFAKCQEHGAAALTEPVTDTLKRADKDLYVIASVDRDRLYIMQTPQIFERKLLEEAYRVVFAEKLRITDEVSAVEHLGRKVVLVPADDFNFKITFGRDFKLAEFVLRQRLGSA
jgi:2-C-methyl-D-erythritol 4-phosphate cytidylyltransferase